jgi:hypothetical protein
VNTESLFLDAQWGCLNSLISGTSTEIYASHLNTTNIVNGCAQAGIAARLCSDLVSGGYDDWLLPSRDALVQMYNNRIILGLEMLGTAWSSTEEGGCCATALNFLDGTLYTRYKDNNHVVKPIRVF